MSTAKKLGNPRLDEASATIERGEIAHTLATHVSLMELQRQLEDAADDLTLLKIVGRFIYYSSVFGGSQASLAGSLAARQDLFRHAEESRVLSDNSVEIASGVFFGAIDEFGDREMRQTTHRSLGQATLKTLARYLGIELSRLDGLILGHRPTQEIVSRVFAGYGVNRELDEAQLFRAFGFHLGTELLADDEFRIFDTFFQTRRPDIARHLQETQVEIGGRMLPSYFWLKRHTVADVEHFEAATHSANQALHFYAGGAERGVVKQWLLEGVREIALVELDFLRWMTIDP